MEAARGRGDRTAADVDPNGLVAFARSVYAPNRRTSSLVRFADDVYGREDRVPFHSESSIRAHWVAELRGRIRGDYDNVLVFTGRKGRGKSTGALSLGLELDPKLTLGQVVFRGGDLVNLYATLRRGQVAIYDEAVLGLLATDFASFESRELVKAVTIARDAHVTTILCLPKFGRLNKSFREDLTDYWFRVDERGSATVHPAYPTERYSEWKGLGWFPDREWSPFTWPSLAGTEIWKLYLKHRKAARLAFHQAAGARLVGTPATGIPLASAGRVYPCPVCGISFGRRDHLQRHGQSQEHLARAAGGRKDRKSDTGGSSSVSPHLSDGTA